MSPLVHTVCVSGTHYGENRNFHGSQIPCAVGSHFRRIFDTLERSYLPGWAAHTFLLLDSALSRSMHRRTADRFWETKASIKTCCFTYTDDKDVLAGLARTVMGRWSFTFPSSTKRRVAYLIPTHAFEADRILTNLILLSPFSKYCINKWLWKYIVLLQYSHTNI